MPELLASILFNLFLLAGSVSLGYLVLRFVYPDIRTFDKKRKLITVAIVGVAISLSGLLIDFAFTGQRVLNLDSFSMPFVFLSTGVYFLALRTFFLYTAASREFVTVGIPIASAVQLVPDVQAKEKVEREKRDELKKLQEEKRQLQKRFENEQRKKEEASKAEQAKKELELKKIAEEKKKLEAALQENRKMEEQRRRKEQEANKIEEEQKEREKKAELERKKRLSQSIGESKTYLEKISEKVAQLKKTEAKQLKKAAQVVQEVKEEKHVEQLKKESISQPVEVKLAVKTAVKPVAEEKKVEKPGVFDWLFGGGKKKEAEKPSEFTTWRTTKEAEQKKVEEKRKAVEEKKKQEEEVEELVSTVTKEAEEKSIEGGPVHRRYLLKGEVKVIANREVAQKEEFGVMVQDIYSQLKTSKTETSIGDVLKVDAPKEVKQVQVAKPVRIEGKKEEKKEEKPTSAVAITSGVSVSDILGTDLFAPTPATQATGGDLFASEAASASSSAGGDIFAQLSEAASGKPSVSAQVESPAAIVKSDVSFVQIQEKDVGCPTCHSKSSKIIFCPYCSTGMCANCSPSIKPVGPGQFVYVCPKCGEEVTVKKKAG